MVFPPISRSVENESVHCPILDDCLIFRDSHDILQALIKRRRLMYYLTFSVPMGLQCISSAIDKTAQNGIFVDEVKNTSLITDITLLAMHSICVGISSGC